MTIRMVVLLACVTFAVLPLLASEPDSVRQTPRGGVVIHANVDSAIVMIDGNRVGLTPLTVDSLTEGVHYVTILHPDVQSWFTGSLRDTLLVRPDTLLVARYDLRHRYFISSEPDGADVYAADSLFGKTPLMLPEMSATLLASLRLRKEGFAEGRPERAAGSPFVLSASLQPEWLPERLNDHALMKLEKGTDNTPLYITGAATILSGTAAAYLKTKADNRYGQYLSTNDPKILSQTRSLDTAAAVALVATQVSVALFAFFLLNE